jgi:hypothetical protein
MHTLAARVRVLQWLLLALAWGTVQFPMAWCDDAGLHPEIPASHASHDHHDSGSVHERVELEIVLRQEEFAAPAPIVARVAPLLRACGGAQCTPAGTVRRADPPGPLTTVRLL